MRVKNLGALNTALAISTAFPSTAHAQSPQRALWLRAAAISPDGKTIAFSYRGDLWRVPSTGGAATPITVHADYDTTPVWSPDGKQIAFASNRYGNFDVFVIPATGGEATRLTFDSADDTPTSFTPDGSGVLFSSATLDSATNVQFPTGAQPELYRVDLKGSMPVRVLTTPALYAARDKGENRLAYSDQKGYEMEWRRHDDSSFARDVWVWDRAANRLSGSPPSASTIGSRSGRPMRNRSTTSPSGEPCWCGRRTSPYPAVGRDAANVCCTRWSPSLSAVSARDRSFSGRGSCRVSGRTRGDRRR